MKIFSKKLTKIEYFRKIFVKFSKQFDLDPIFEKFDFVKNFRKIESFSKISKNFDLKEDHRL